MYKFVQKCRILITKNYAIKLDSRRLQNKNHSTLLTIRRNYHGNEENKAMDINTNVAKDVILFKYDKPRYFKFISFFGATQFAFWGYLSYLSLTTLKDIPVPRPATTDDDSSPPPWWRQINLGNPNYKHAFTGICFLIGSGILTVTWMYTLRSVRYLILRKGGKKATIVTYSPAGVNRLLTLDLDKISCKDVRSAARSQLPLKVKGHYLYYLMDMRGEFRNPQLFDQTAGIGRKWNNNA